jgi:hypothetical protein
MGLQRPASVTNALRVQWALVAVGAVGTVLAVVMREDLLRAWADSNPAARAIVAEGGLVALEQSAISIPSFVPVAVVSFIVYACLAWVIAVLLREGHAWARWSLLALAASLLFAAFVVYRADPPTPFAVLGVVTVVLDLVLVWFLLQRDTGAPAPTLDSMSGVRCTVNVFEHLFESVRRGDLDPRPAGHRPRGAGREALRRPRGGPTRMGGGPGPPR